MQLCLTLLMQYFYKQLMLSKLFWNMNFYFTFGDHV